VVKKDGPSRNQRRQGKKNKIRSAREGKNVKK
jgi:hypothetical protein